MENKQGPYQFGEIMNLQKNCCFIKNRKRI